MLRILQRALVLVPLLAGCKPSSLDPIVTGSSGGPETGGGDTSGGTPTTGTTSTGGPEPAASTGIIGETSTGVMGETSTGEASTSSSSSTVPVDTTLEPGTSTGSVLDTSSESSSTGAPDDETTTGSTGEPVMPAMPSECLDSTQLAQAPDHRVLDGLEVCQNGQLHRPAGVACAHPFVVELCADPMKCDEACDELGDGVCNESFENTCDCRYPCETDADCGDNAACLCRADDTVDQKHVVPISQCYPAQCRTDADCGEFQCGLSPGFCGPGNVLGLFCRGPADECQTHQECFFKQLGNMCWFDKLKDHWACTESAICE